MTIVIMGLVIAPLCMALVQALNTIPQSGATTQHSTDSSRLQSAMVDDVGQAQGITVLGVFQVPNLEFYEDSPTQWNPGTSVTKGAFTCGSTGTLFDVWWSSGSASLNSDGTRNGHVPWPASGVEPSPIDGSTNSANTAVTVERYQLAETQLNTAGAYTLQITRSESTSGGTANSFGSATPLLTGYCRSGDTVATVSYVSTIDSGQQQGAVNLKLNVRPTFSEPLYPTTIQAKARPTGATDS